jgi:NADH:ubiquinone oxidoreductase subunit 6 (subunit J)
MKHEGAVKGLFLGLLALLMVLAVMDVSWPDPSMDELSSIEVAKTMFSTENPGAYALVVFMIGLLLLVAILGGVFLAKEEKP